MATRRDPLHHGCARGGLGLNPARSLVLPGERTGCAPHGSQTVVGFQQPDVSSRPSCVGTRDKHRPNSIWRHPESPWMNERGARRMPPVVAVLLMASSPNLRQQGRGHSCHARQHPIAACFGSTTTLTRHGSSDAPLDHLRPAGLASPACSPALPAEWPRHFVGTCPNSRSTTRPACWKVSSTS